MSETPIPPAGSAGDAHPTESPKPAKRRRRWRWVVGALVLVVILLIIFAPTIASTGVGRSIIVGRINKGLDGVLQIKDWSLGWFSGAKMSGVRVTQDGGQIAELQQLDTELTVWDVMRGKYDLGKARIRGLDVLVKIYPDGTTNIHRLLKLRPSSQPTKVPDLRGDIDADFRGTIARQGMQPILIDPSTAKLVIADINKPITNKMDLAVRTGGANSGKFSAEGTAKLFENNTLDWSKLHADENITIEGLDLAGAATVIGPELGLDRMEGKANGTFTAKSSGADQMTLWGTLDCDNFAATGPAFAGDVYKSARISFKIPQAVLNRSTGQIRTENPITVQTDQGSITASLDATQAALSNLAANRAPGSSGSAKLTADFDLAKLAQQLPNLLRIKKEIKPTSGRINHVIEIALANDKASIKSQTDLTDLAATNEKNQEIKAEPIHLTFAATSFGGGGGLPDLRDIDLALRSAFANLKAKGPSLAQFTLTADADLAKFQQQTGQFINFGSSQFSGKLNANLSANGQLHKEDDQAAIDGVITLTGVKIVQENAATVDEPWMQTSVKGSLVRGKQDLIKAIRGTAITVRSGNEQAPSIDLAASGDLAVAPGNAISVPAFTVSRCNINLAAAQKEIVAIGDLFKSLGSISKGTLNLQAAGSYAEGVASVKSLSGTATDLTFENRTPDGKVAKQLNATSNITLAEPITVKGFTSTLVATGAVKATGQFASASPAAQSGYSGAYTTTQRLATDGAAISLIGDLAIANFVVGNPAQPKFSEKAIRLDNQLKLDQKAKTLAINKLSLDMPESKALALTVTGAIGDYSAQRTLDNMRILLTYDAAKLLQIVRPMLPPDQQANLANLKLTGSVRDREIKVWGKYPTTAPADRRNRPVDPIQFVRASGMLSFDEIDYQGMSGQFKELPFDLSNGVVRLIYADRAAANQFPSPYPLNNGTLDLGGLELSLAGAELRVNSPRKDYKFLDNVNLNAEFVEKYLGRLHPLFSVPKNAKGQMVVTMNELNQLPLGQTLIKPSRRDPGRAKFTFSITNLQLDSIAMSLLAEQLQLKRNADGTVTGNIRDAVISIEDGMVTSNLGLDLGGQTIACRDTQIRLSDEKIVKMDMLIPKALLTQALLARLGSGQNLIKDQIVVPVKGTLRKMEFDIIGTAIKSVNVGGALDEILKGIPGKK